MLRSIFLLVTVLTISGCNGFPKVPPMNFQDGGRIGIYIDVSEKIKHKHMGTTIFNNNEKVIAQSWNIEGNLQNIVVTELEQAGYQVVIIPKGSLSINTQVPMIEHKEKTWEVTLAQKPLFDKLKTEMKLDAVFIFQQGNTRVNLECGAGGCSSHYMDAPGLFSRSMFGLAYYRGSWGFDWWAYSLNPPVDLANTSEIYYHFSQTSTGLSAMPDFNEPEKLESVTDKEMQHIKELIFKDIKHKTQILIDSMNSHNQ